MIITIYGEHTAPYGDHPYEQGKDFETCLKTNWVAVTFFNFNSISAADVHIDPYLVPDMTVRQVHERLLEAVRVASDQTDWEIWEVPCP